VAKILCIEDEADLREDIAFELIEAGYEVSMAGNGKEALQVLKKEKPDLILCDVSMPVMDGRMFVGEVRDKYSSLSRTPIVFLTALADRKDIIIGKKLGADDYLLKPVDYGILLATIESRLREVERVEGWKNKELITLYKTMASSGLPDTAEQIKPERSTLVVATITNSEVDLTEVHRSLRSKGHTVVEMDSGKAFLDVYPAMTLDLCVLSYETADLQGSMILHYMRDAGSIDFPVVLAIPAPETKPHALDHMPGFDLCQYWPCDVTEFTNLIEILSLERELRQRVAI